MKRLEPPFSRDHTFPPIITALRIDGQLSLFRCAAQPAGSYQATFVEAIIGALRQFISRAVGSEEAKGMLRGGEAVGLRVAITEHTI